MLRIGLLVDAARAALLEPGATSTRAHALIADLPVTALVVALTAVIGVTLQDHALGAAGVERHRALALAALANLPARARNTTVAAMLEIRLDIGAHVVAELLTGRALAARAPGNALPVRAGLSCQTRVPAGSAVLRVGIQVHAERAPAIREDRVLTALRAGIPARTTRHPDQTEPKH